jgi:cytochrome c-type biogenesis protein CcmH
MRAALFAFALLAASPALADSLLPAARWANVQLPDPEQERQAKGLMESIRCLVCAGQSVADSNAEQAGDVRSMIRERILAGDDPETIRGWLISRFGDGISYRPPFAWRNVPLFAAPLLLILAGLWLARGRFRRRKER